MILNEPGLSLSSFKRDERLIVSADTDGVADFLRQRYPHFEIETVDSYLEAICRVRRRPARAVLGGVDPAFRQLPNAVGGLREAAGASTKLILCCRPDAEPSAREALFAGADDYLIVPLMGEEVDKAIDFGRVDPIVLGQLHEAPTAGMSELAALSDALAALDGDPSRMLQRSADLVKKALKSQSAMVVVEGAVARNGEWEGDPVLAAAIEINGLVIGQVSLGPPMGEPFGLAEVLKLRQYATLIGRLLEAAQRQRHWRQLAMVDELSQLPNRRRLLGFLNDILQRAARERFRVTLLIFDIDDFKGYNDRYGHQAGDEIIRLAGQLFREHCRDEDLVTRYGGDEFAVVFWDAEQPRVAGSKHPTDVLGVLHRFKEALGQFDLSRWKGIQDSRLTISGGLASYPWDAATPEELIAKADSALLQAKRAGKNRIYLIGNDAEPTVLESA